MTPLRQRMIEDMQVRNLSPHTQSTYVLQVSLFARYFGKSPDQLGPEEIRSYQVYLTKEKKLAPGSILIAVAALRFLYQVTLHKNWSVEDIIPAPKKPQKLPIVLSPEEVLEFLSCVASPKHRTILTTCYAAGLRISEAVRLRPVEIDSRRMVIRVDQGKGQKDRYVMLSPRLLEILRDWWRMKKPQHWLFPGDYPGRHISKDAVEQACQEARLASHISKGRPQNNIYLCGQRWYVRLVMSQTADQLMLKVLATLNEAQARWFVAREVLDRGRGGLQALHQETGMSRPTILRGIRELRARTGLAAGERVRRPGGGRKRLEAADPGWERALDRIMDENTAGDPMSLLRWTNKSTARIAEELSRQGHPASDETVRRKLRELGYSLQANAKTQEESSGAGRDEQFRYVNRQVKRYLARGQPVLSVDTKKKERVGNFKNSGQTWRPKGQPVEVNVYDYPHLGEGSAIPYGTYDVHRNEGFVNVGMSHDTAEFAVESLRRWWKLFGRRHYSEAPQLLLCADGGGSNGSRNRAWKYYLQHFADQMGLQVTVCHYPPGTSKWNKIEHRMFSFISLNWKGQPLVSYETVVNLIGATRTKTGLRVKAALDAKQYEAGVRISDEEMERINLRPHNTNPLWNYTISPRTGSAKK